MHQEEKSMNVMVQKVRKVIKDKGTMTVGIRQSLPRQSKKK